MDNLPIGCIFCFPSHICPEGYLPCDGRELSKEAYSELYNLIRGTWGETASTFCLPDLRGQFIRGWDDGDGVDPDSGADSVRKFGSTQSDAIQGHRHDLLIEGELSEALSYFDKKTIEYGTNTISSNESTTFNSVVTPLEREQAKEKVKKFDGFLNEILKSISKDMFSQLEIRHTHKLPKIQVEDATNSTFQKIRVSVETRPKNIALLYCMKVK